VTTQDLRYLNYRRLDKECQVFSTKEILQEQLTVERKKLKNTAVTADDINIIKAARPVDNKQVDDLINSFKHLTGGGKLMNGWYATRIRQLGVDKFVQLAKTAEQEGKNPARYFSWLLKNN
jgi:hypothetical protein